MTLGVLRYADGSGQVIKYLMLAVCKLRGEIKIFSSFIGTIIFASVGCK